MELSSIKTSISKTGSALSLVLLLFFDSFFCAQPGLTGISWNTDFEKTRPDRILPSLSSFAKKEKRPLLLYFHADWCSNCHELEELLAAEFADSIASGWIPVRIDITDSAVWERPAMDLFGVYGAPALAFVDRQGNLQKHLTLVGAHPPRRALKSVLDQLHGP
jgi:thiol:disulfide interchange protein